MELFTFRITGLSPLLSHNPAGMGNGGGDELKGKKKYVAEEEAAAAAYRNERGEFYHPSIAFRAAIFRACTGRKIGKMSAKTVVAASVFPAERRCVLIDPRSDLRRDQRRRNRADVGQVRLGVDATQRKRRPCRKTIEPPRGRWNGQ